MSKALSTNVQTGKAGNSRPVYLIQIIPISGTTLYLSYPVSFTDDYASQNYDGSKIKKGGISYVDYRVRLEEGGTVGTVSGFTLQLENADLYSDTFLLTSWENAGIEVRLIFAGLSGDIWANAVPLFKGYIESISSDYKKIEIKCADGWHKAHRSIVDHGITDVDYSNCPTTNLGKMIPLIYGDFYKSKIHKSAIGYVSGVSADYGHTDMAPVILVKKGETYGTSDFLVCGHNINEWTTLQGTALACYIQNLNAYSKQSGITGGSPGVVNGIYMITDATIASYGARARFEEIPVYYTNSGNSIFPIYAVDENPDNYTRVGGDGGVSTGKKGSVTYRISRERFNGILSGAGGSAKLYLAAYVSSGSLTNDTLRVEYTLGSQSTDEVITTLNNYTTGLTDLISYFGFDFGDDGWDYLSIEIYYYQSSEDDGAIISFRNVYLLYYNTGAGGYDVVYAPLKGRMYGAWIDGSRTNTPAPSDLIQYPEGIIESLIRDELNLSTVDENAFDDIEDISSYGINRKYAGYLDKMKYSLDYIKQLCLEGHLFYIQDYKGEECIYPMIRIVNSEPAIGIETIIHGTFSLERIDMDHIYNEFYLLYNKNLATGEYESLEFVRAPDESFSTSFTSLGETTGYHPYWQRCADIFTDLGIVRTKEIKADYIRDQYTAQWLIKKLIDWFTFLGSGLRHIVKFETYLDTIDLEIGDQRKINHPLLPSTVNDLNFFLLIGQKIIPSKDKIELTWLNMGYFAGDSGHFDAGASWQLDHDLNDDDVLVQCWDDDGLFFFPNMITVTDASTVTVTTEGTDSGNVVIVPMSSALDTYTEDISPASATWNINHGLDSEDLIVQCYDSSNVQIIPGGVLIVDTDNITVTFGEAVEGKVCIAAMTLDATKKITYTETVASSNPWTITHDLKKKFIIAQVYDSAGNLIIPDSMDVTSRYILTITFDEATAGKVNIIGVQ